MSLRDDLARVAARDARYAIDVYEFVFATIDHARRLRKRAEAARRTRGRRPRKVGAIRHLTGQDFCLTAKDLAQDLYGRMALTVLRRWGLRSTSDLGNVVYNLIASGDLETHESDARSDFDDVFDFEDELGEAYVMDLSELE